MFVSYMFVSYMFVCYICLMEAPFVFGQLTETGEFTDRKEETEQLIRNMDSAINTVVISPRRWGKSSLIRHAATVAQKQDRRLRVCFMDLYNVRSEEQFYREYANAILNATATKWDGLTTQIGKLFKKLIPRISFSPDPNAEISLSLNWSEVRQDPSDILDLADRIATERKLKVVVCIDEFQNLSRFDEPMAFQQTLRAHWQHHSKASYCLYGSRRHMMTEVFASSSMPFYKFADILFLQKIKLEDWIPFIQKRFADTGKKIDPGIARYIAEAVQCHPHYVQQLAQLTWFRTKKVCRQEQAEAALTGLLLQLSMLFQATTDGLTRPQESFLRALIDKEEKPSSKRSVAKYGFGTSGNVSRVKEALLNKEVIDILGKRIDFLDPVYELWLKRYYFI